MTAREELAAVLAEHEADVTSYDAADLWGCRCGWETSDWDALHLHVADALLASPAHARVIREAKAEAWREGFKQGGPMHDVDYDNPGSHRINPYRAQTEEPT